MASLPTNSSPSASDWLQPASEQQGLSGLAQTIRERLWIIVALTLLGGALTAAYALTAEKEYEARADLLVAPVPTDNAILASVGLFTESTQPATDVETAAQVIDDADIAARAAAALDNGESAQQILDETEVAPIPDSNVVAVTARTTDPETAQEVANAYATAAVEERTDEVHRRVDEVLPRLREQLAAAQAGGTAAETLADQVAQLEILKSTDNPTLRLETLATVPESAVWPRPVLLIVGGLVGGIALGLAIAFIFKVLDPRLRREEQLRALYRLPILARIPREGRHRAGPLSPDRLSPAAREAYRTLRGMLAATESRRGGPQVVLITGAGPSEGKTTTAINLAAALALAGQRTILIESDLRRPAIGAALGLQPGRGVVNVLIESVSLEDALVVSRPFGPNLQFLLADETGPAVTELFSLPTADRLLTEAREAADYVIVDAPPLVDVIDALSLARMADAVLLVAHLGRTHLRRLKELGELLAGNGIRPAGIALLGVSRPDRSDYYLGAPLSGDGQPAKPPVPEERPVERQPSS